MQEIDGIIALVEARCKNEASIVREGTIYRKSISTRLDAPPYSSNIANNFTVTQFKMVKGYIVLAL